LRSKPAELAEAVRDSDVGDACLLVGGEQLLASAREPQPPHPAQGRRAEISLEMSFQRAGPDAGEGGEGVEFDRLIRPAFEPAERARKARGQSDARSRSQLAAIR
jgi:hypothetical protein